MGAFDWASSAADFGMQLFAQDFQSDEASYARDWSADQARENRRFQESSRATQYQTAVKDLQADGLNPMLAYSQGGAGNLSGSAGQSSAAGGVPPLRVSESNLRGAEAAKSQSAQALLDAQRDNVVALTDKTRAEEQEIKARTPTHAVSIDKMRQDIQESVQRIETLMAQAGHYTASADQARQQVVNLKEIVPQIRARVEQLKGLADLQKAQISQIAIGVGKTEAEIEEIAQRIRANLPALQAKLLDIEEISKQAELPGKTRVSDVMESKLGGIVSIFRAMFK